MKIGNLLKSFAFRLTLLYFVLFGLSVGLLLAFIYFAIADEMEREIRNTINLQIAQLEQKFEDDGPKQTAELINDLVAQDTDRMFVYLLMGPKEKVLGGNIALPEPEMLKKNSWVEVESVLQPEKSDAASKVLGRTVALSKSYLLLVGYNFSNVEKIERAVLRILATSAGLTIILAVVTGLVFQRQINRRLEAVNLACRKVIGGALGERAVVSGSGDEFDHLAKNFNAMLVRIEELIDGIKQVSSNVAHDLRTPLNRIRNRLETILLYPPSKELTREEIKQILSEIDRLVATFNAILRISQAEAGAGVEAFTDIDLSQITSDVVDFYSAVAEEKDITLDRFITERIITHGDKHLLLQAFANVLDNAIKYSPKGGAVEVALTQSEGFIVFSVADKGPGIPEEYYAKVTEKFFRLERSRSSPGNGLGLSLVSAVVKLHQGELIFLDNHPGLRVSVLLPIGI